jgi:hypothetical protein
MNGDVRRSGWQTVRERIAHPDHQGVIGDLVKHLETDVYRLLAYNEASDQYEPYAVPHVWARKQDPEVRPVSA